MIVLLNYKIVLNHFPGKLLIFLYLGIFSLFPFFYSKFGFDSLVSYTSYIGLIFVPLAVLITLIKLQGLSFRFTASVIFIWLLAAVIQRFFNPDFFNFLLTRSSGSGFMGRGVNSLAPEPTYYGSVVLLFLIIFYLNFPNDKWLNYILLILFIQLLFLSMSSTIFSVLLISFFLYYIYKFFCFQLSIKYLFIFIISILFIYFIIQIFNDTFIDTRFYKILDILISKPEIILFDESINERLNHALFPLISFFENYGFPMGYGNFQEYIIRKSSDPKYFYLFQRLNIEHYKKIMSGYGAVFFELGILGISVPYYIFGIFKPFLINNVILFIFITLNLLLFTSISLNNPLILFVFGNLLYLNYKNNTKYLINNSKNKLAK